MPSPPSPLSRCAGEGEPSAASSGGGARGGCRSVRRDEAVDPPDWAGDAVASGGPAGSHRSPRCRVGAAGRRIASGAVRLAGRGQVRGRDRDWAAAERQGGTCSRPGGARRGPVVCRRDGGGPWVTGGRLPGVVSRCPGPHPQPRGSGLPGRLPGPGAGMCRLKEIIDHGFDPVKYVPWGWSFTRRSRWERIVA